MLKAFLLGCALAVLPALTSASAQNIYRWRDSLGVIHFSDRTPGVPARIIHLHPTQHPRKVSPLHSQTTISPFGDTSVVAGSYVYPETPGVDGARSTLSAANSANPFSIDNGASLMEGSESPMSEPSLDNEMRPEQEPQPRQRMRHPRMQHPRQRRTTSGVRSSTHHRRHVVN